MLSLETKWLLAQYFKGIADQEILVENERIILSENSLFQPYEAFRWVDWYSKGQVDPDDIITFCSENGVLCTYQDAADLISQYDENLNGWLNFNEF